MFLSVHRGEVDRVFSTLSYLDVVNHAKRATTPALFSVGLVDDITETAGTLTAAAKLLREHGARSVRAGRCGSIPFHQQLFSFGKWQHLDPVGRCLRRAL